MSVHISTRRLLLAARLASLPLTLILSGCVSGLLTSKAPAQQVYVLRPAAGDTAATAPPAGTTLQVLSPLAAPGLGGDGIAVLRGARMDYYTGGLWAAAAPSLLQSLAVDALRAHHAFSEVETETGPFTGQYVLSLELQHFEAEYSGDGPPTVHVAVVATLGRRSERDVLQSFTAESRQVATADRMQAVVAAFDAATAQVLSQISGKLAPAAATAAR